MTLNTPPSWLQEWASMPKLLIPLALLTSALVYLELHWIVSHVLNAKT